MLISEILDTQTLSIISDKNKYNLIFTWWIRGWGAIDFNFAESYDARFSNLYLICQNPVTTSNHVRLLTTLEVNFTTLSHRITMYGINLTR